MARGFFKKVFSFGKKEVVEEKIDEQAPLPPINWESLEALRSGAPATDGQRPEPIENRTELTAPLEAPPVEPPAEPEPQPGGPEPVPPVPAPAPTPVEPEPQPVPEEPQPHPTP